MPNFNPGMFIAMPNPFLRSARPFWGSPVRVLCAVMFVNFFLVSVTEREVSIVPVFYAIHEWLWRGRSREVLKKYA